MKKYQPTKHEAILPFALLEYAGISIKKIFSKIPNIPDSLLCAKPLDLKSIKEHFEEYTKKKITEGCIKGKLEKQLKHDNKYSYPFVLESKRILPEIYSLIIAQLSWDRFTKMEWNKGKGIKSKDLLLKIRKEIHQFICKENLYTLRLLSPY